MTHLTSRRLVNAGLFALLCGMLWTIAPGRASAQVPLGEWVITGPPIGDVFVSAGTLVVLADGTPLLIGRDTAPVEQYHLDTGAWTASGSLLVPRGEAATVTLLPSGLVLLAGGSDSGSAGTTAELYDPVSGVSTLTGNMHFARAGHRATLLNSGHVLVSGGTDASNQLVGPSEIYDPLTGIWSVSGVLNTFRVNHTAVLLRSGKVLVAGGSLADPTSAEIYDPTSGTWTLTIPMDTPVFRASGVLLLDGHVLVAGGPNGSGQGVSSQLYDPSAGTWTPSVTVVPSVFRGVAQIEVVRLHNGIPLLVFSTCVTTQCFQRAFLFDLNVGIWNSVPPNSEFSRSASFSLAALPDGRVLMTGRRQLSSPSFALTTSAQLFRPDNTTPRLVVSPLTVDLGETSPGIAVQQTVTLQNTGGATLTGSATTAAPFNVVSGSPFTLAPGMSTTALVEFTPSGFGEFAGVVEFMSNGNWLSVPVTGVAGVQLSGRVTDTTGAGVGGVTVNLHGASSGDIVTDATGHFAFVVSPNNGYTVTPTSPGVAFTPGTRSVLVGTQAVSGLDFTAAVVDALAVFVTSLYQNVLERGPEPAGLAGWTGFLRQNCNPSGFSTIAQAFFDSQEFRTFRPLTLTGLVTVLYRTFLAREPEPAGLTAWVEGFRQARLGLAQDFTLSAEFQSLLPDRTSRPAVTVLVTRFYTEILGRAPEPAGLAGWVDHVVATRDPEGAAVAFLASGEFEGRALTHRDYVVILYRGVLGREPDPGGLDGWETVLRSDLLLVLNGGFIPSAEFQGRIPLVCGS